MALTGRPEVTVDPSSNWYVNVFAKPHTNLSCDHSQPSIEEQSKKDICKLATVTRGHCCSCEFRSPLSYGHLYWATPECVCPKPPTDEVRDVFFQF